MRLTSDIRPGVRVLASHYKEFGVSCGVVVEVRVSRYEQAYMRSAQSPCAGLSARCYLGRAAASAWIARCWGKLHMLLHVQ